YEVGPVRHDVIDVQLVAANVLADQDRRADELAQLAVAEGGDPAILVGVLGPELARLVAGPPDAEGIGPGVVLAGRVEHQIHVIADGLPRFQDRGHLAGDWAAVPAVDL